MGVVTLVSLPSSSETGKTYYAIKTIPKSLAASTSAGRIFNERDALLKFSNHKYIAKLFGTRKDLTNLFFVGEPILGGPLHLHFRKCYMKKFPIERALYYAAELLCALEYIHSSGYVHRDIKASNILLSSKGSIKLIDFGYSKKMEDEDKTMTFCGTLHAMAPEIVNRCGYGKIVDCWSFGVLLYEMITGQAPFGYDSGGDYARKEMEKRINLGGGCITFQDDIFSTHQMGEDSEKLIRLLLLPNIQGEKEDDKTAVSRLTSWPIIRSHRLFSELEFGQNSDGMITLGEVGRPPYFDRSIGELENKIFMDEDELLQNNGEEESSDPFAGF